MTTQAQRLAVRIASLLCLTLFPTFIASAQQVNPGTETGFPIYGSLHGDSLDVVNLQNGSLHISIPLLTVRERGRSFTWSYIYDTPSWQKVWVPEPTQQNKNAGFYEVSRTTDPDWQFSSPFAWTLGYIMVTKACAATGTNYTYYSQYYVQDPDGTKHQFPLIWQSTACQSQELSGPATDGSGMILTLTPNGGTGDVGYVTLKDGTQIGVGVSTEGLTDANGNTASPSSDMLARNLVTQTSGELSNGTPYTDLTYTDSNGHSQTFQIQYATFNFQTSLCGSGYTCYEDSGTSVEPVKLILPDSTSYAFSYQNDSMLQLTQMTLPTGGSVSYTTAGYGAPQPNTGRNPTYIYREGVGARTVDTGTGNYEWTYSGGTVTDPLGNQQVHTFQYITVNNVSSASPVETSVSYYQGSASTGKLLRTVSKTWTGETVYSDPNAPSFLGNLRVTSETTTLDNNQESQVQTDYETFTWNGFTFTRLNPTEKREYGYGSGAPGSLVRRTDYTYLHTNNQTYVNLNIVDRTTSVVTYNASGTIVAQTQNEFDNYTAGIQGTSAVQHNSSFGSSYTTRGNVTAIERWRNTDGTWLTTRNQYNDVGDIISTTDPNGNTTSFSYSDVWGNTTCAPTSGPALAYLTQTTDAVGEITKSSYNSCTGLTASSTDANSQTTTFTYDDMGRPLVASYPDGGQTTVCYTEDPGGTCYSNSFPIKATTTKLIQSGANLITTSVFDGMGRLSEEQVNSDPQGTVYTDTTYDGDGRVASVSNPYRSTSDSTYGITSFQYDGLNRKIQVTDPDSNSIVTTQYCGSTTLVTDEASHWRRSTSDALGRLIEVDEPNSTTATVGACPAQGDPIWVTTYGYDALDDLTSVVQGSSRNRTFTYNSVKELTQSSNPESGSICYGTLSSGACQNNGYDGDGNLLYKTDARAITTTYSYDHVNRSTGATYSNGDPAITYSYSGTNCLGGPTCYNVGRRTSVTDAGGTEYFSYDKMGRELVEQRTTGGVTKNTSYAYDLLGDLASLTYPSGRAITYAYDSAARPVSAIDQTNSINYALNATYAPQDALASLTMGSSGSYAGIKLTHIYNSRLQPCWMYATTGTALATTTNCTATDPGPGNILDLQYKFDWGAGDNGNSIGITNNRDTTRTQSFTYDQVNRIVTAKTSSTTGSNCWGEAYTIDEWANLTGIAALSGYSGCTQENLSVSATTNNQLSATSYSYDASGNMLTDGANTYGYNAESEIKSAAGVSYTYDGDGDRVEKSSDKIYWYGAGSEILDESDASGNFTNEYVFFGGKRIAMRNVSTGTIYYYAEDMLGSSRTIVQAGQTSPCYDADFYPFGGERDIINTCTQNYKFEGKERDTETGNDDFGARYYSSRVGRWLSADWSAVPEPVPYANLTNPQTLNLYGMVGDNPETFADLDGHDPAYENGGGGSGGTPPNAALGAAQPTSTETCHGGATPAGNQSCTSTGQTEQVSSDQENVQNAAKQANVAQQQNATQPPNNQQSTSGINPNYKLPTGDILLKKASDFSAGAGDVLSLGTTYLARKYIFHSDSVVDKGSGAYMAGAVTGAAIGVALGKEMGPQGKIFGTRFGGNQPLLNSGDTLRVGWSYIRSSGQYVFRIGGTAVGLIKDNPHINLWPPSWWLK